MNIKKGTFFLRSCSFKYNIEEKDFWPNFRLLASGYWMLKGPRIGCGSVRSIGQQVYNLCSGQQPSEFTAAFALLS